jgi:hypothetical protein
VPAEERDDLANAVETPLGAVVVMDRPEIVAAQPETNNKEGSRGISLLSMVLRAESQVQAERPAACGRSVPEAKA